MSHLDHWLVSAADHEAGWLLGLLYGFVPLADDDRLGRGRGGGGGGVVAADWPVGHHSAEVGGAARSKSQ